MGFRGDAMKITNTVLEGLLELHAIETKLKKLKLALTELATGKHLEALRDEILSASQEVSTQRGKTEEIEREIARVATDLELVERRLAKDNELVATSSNAKDIQGIQHEIQTLTNRKDDLETSELELMESLDSESSALEQLREHKRVLEEKLEAARSQTESDSKVLQAEILQLESDAGKLRAASDPEVLAVYDQRATRGVPVGRLLTSTCGACNMSLTSTAMNELHKIPQDEMARCPECSAILVRS